MKKAVTTVMAMIALVAALSPAQGATKKARFQVKRYTKPSTVVQPLEGDLGATNPGAVNPADDIGFLTEYVTEGAGIPDPRPGQGTPIDQQPLKGTPADDEVLRGTPADTFYGGVSFDLPAGAEQIKIAFVDEAANTMGAPISWSTCAIHGSVCSGNDIRIAGCSYSGQRRSLWAYNGVRRLAIWVFANDGLGLLYGTGCETDAVAFAGTVRIDYLA